MPDPSLSPWLNCDSTIYYRYDIMPLPLVPFDSDSTVQLTIMKSRHVRFTTDTELNQSINQSEFFLK